MASPRHQYYHYYSSQEYNNSRPNLPPLGSGAQEQDMFTDHSSLATGSKSMSDKKQYPSEPHFTGRNASPHDTLHRAHEFARLRCRNGQGPEFVVTPDRQVIPSSRYNLATQYATRQQIPIQMRGGIYDRRHKTSNQSLNRLSDDSTPRHQSAGIFTPVGSTPPSPPTRGMAGTQAEKIRQTGPSQVYDFAAFPGNAQNSHCFTPVASRFRPPTTPAKQITKSFNTPQDSGSGSGSGDSRAISESFVSPLSPVYTTGIMTPSKRTVYKGTSHGAISGTITPNMQALTPLSATFSDNSFNVSFDSSSSSGTRGSNLQWNGFNTNPSVGRTSSRLESSSEVSPKTTEALVAHASLPWGMNTTIAPTYGYGVWLGGRARQAPMPDAPGTSHPGPVMEPATFRGREAIPGYSFQGTNGDIFMVSNNAQLSSPDSIVAGKRKRETDEREAKPVPAASKAYKSKSNCISPYGVAAASRHSKKSNNDNPSYTSFTNRKTNTIKSSDPHAHTLRDPGTRPSYSTKHKSSHTSNQHSNQHSNLAHTIQANRKNRATSPNTLQQEGMKKKFHAELAEMAAKQHQHQHQPDNLGRVLSDDELFDELDEYLSGYGDEDEPHGGAKLPLEFLQ